jgi:hypothetical protein
MRLRLIAIPFCSFKCAASRSSVQEAKGSPSARGSVSAAAITSATCAGEYVAGRPQRGRSSRPARPSALKRWMRLRTVSASRRSRSAIAGGS